MKQREHEKRPSGTSYAWIGFIKRTPFWVVLLYLLGIYAVIDLAFGGIYCLARVFEPKAGAIDFFYFSFVTSLTIGYGDFYPTQAFGKVLVIIHGCFTAVYFAGMIAILSTKLFYPEATIVFSQNLCINRKNKLILFRVLNTHRERLINPEVRVFISEHCVGNVIAPTHKVAKFDDMPYLGRHDFSWGFPDKAETGEKSYLAIEQELLLAAQHDKAAGATGGLKSRCKISISVTGSYGMQQISFAKDYYPMNVEFGIGFKPIQYNDKDQKRGNIRYADFPNFWDDFDTILREQETSG